MENSQQRFIACDIHRHYVMFAGVNKKKEIVLKPQKVSMNSLRNWAEVHLQASDELVIEATANVWAVYESLLPFVASIQVAHAQHVKLIAQTATKTDRRDSLTLARLLAVEMIPAIWIPPVHVRELRSLINHRQHLVKQRTACKNRLQGILFRHNLVAPEKNAFLSSLRSWWQSLPLSSIEQLRIQQEFQTLDLLDQQLQQVAEELAKQSLNPEWMNISPYLIQLPGISMVCAMTILSAIGEIARFPSAKQLTAYAGLAIRVHDSGETHQTGRITKEGRKELRRILVESAWVAVRYSSTWRQTFEKLAQRRGKKKAIVAIARKLLVTIWHVWTKHEADEFAAKDAVARAFFRWGAEHRLARRHGFKLKEFVAYQLEAIGLSA